MLKNDMKHMIFFLDITYMLLLKDDNSLTGLSY